jgi:ferritin-like metal-binding protein YciE
MAKLNTLEDLYIEELQDLYDAENQIIKALPKMAKASTSLDLKRAFNDHLEQTRTHVTRLEQVFDQIGSKAKGKACKAMQGLLEEGEELMDTKADPTVLDAGLIAAAQRVEHYEMAGYGCLRTWAKLIGHQESARLLQQTLDEEGQTDEKLTKLAERIVNIKAAGA